MLDEYHVQVRPCVEVSTRLPYVHELGDDDARPKHNRVDGTLDLLVNTGMLNRETAGGAPPTWEPVVYTYTTTEVGEAGGSRAVERKTTRSAPPSATPVPIGSPR